jgi:hypothetical protein
LEEIIDLINHSSKNLKALVPTMKSILHSEIRIAIKILTIIFLTGIITPAMADIINHQIIGTVINPSQ